MSNLDCKQTLPATNLNLRNDETIASMHEYHRRSEMIRSLTDKFFRNQEQLRQQDAERLRQAELLQEQERLRFHAAMTELHRKILERMDRDKVEREATAQSL